MRSSFLFSIGLMLFVALSFIFYVQFKLPDSLPLSDTWRFSTCVLHTDSYERMQCSRVPIENLVEKKSAQVALDYVYELQKEGFISECHVPSHWIGEANLKKFEFDPARAFATCAEGCLEGCHHGVIEGYGNVYPEATSDISLCQSLAEDDRVLYRQCLHGLGHAIMRHHRLSLDESAALCSNLEDSFATQACVSGVQMEFMDRYIQDGADWFAKKIPEICKDVSEDYMRACIGGIGYGAMVVTGHNLEDSEQLCELLNSSKDIEVCKHEAKAEEKLNRLEKTNDN